VFHHPLLSDRIIYVHERIDLLGRMAEFPFNPFIINIL
jgi:hypothetical protein